MRNWVHRNLLFKVDISRVSAAKAELLEIYRTQTQIQYEWQLRPILTRESIEQICSMPEYFLISDPTSGPLSVFPQKKLRILAAYLAERHGKKHKDRVVAFFNWLSGQGHA